MCSLRVSLFGRLDVRVDERGTTRLSGRKVQELFCYLCLYRQRPHSREAVAGLLWSDCLTARSRKCLRQALWQLQAAIGSQTHPDGDSVLLLDSDWVQLNPRADLWIDVAKFEEAFRPVSGLPGRELDAQTAQALHGAVQLYRGHLLEGWYQDWCLYERERLQNMYLAMVDKLIDYAEATHAYEAALEYGNRILRHDVAHERTYRKMMRLHYLAGDRTAALRQYGRCAAILDKELGVRPTRSTVALYEQIRQDRLDRPASTPADVDHGSQVAPVALTEVLARLRQLEALLTNTQHHVSCHIQAVEATLNDQQTPIDLSS